MHSYVSNVGFNQNSSNQAGFNEKPCFLYHLKKPEVRPRYIGSYPACAIYTTSALRWDQTKRHGVSFSLSIALVFLSFSYFVFACTFVTLHFAKHNEKRLKCERICKFLSCFYFPHSGWRKWPEVKFHLLSNARERAHESVNGPLTIQKISSLYCSTRILSPSKGTQS